MVIENVAPEIDGGRFAIKRTIGERVMVEADIFADGHDLLAAVLKFRAAENSEWSETPMELLSNDRWRGEFTVTKFGNYFYYNLDRAAGDYAIICLINATSQDAVAAFATEIHGFVLKDIL